MVMIALYTALELQCMLITVCIVYTQCMVMIALYTALELQCMLITVCLVYNNRYCSPL